MFYLSTPYKRLASNVMDSNSRHAEFLLRCSTD